MQQKNICYVAKKYLLGSKKGYSYAAKNVFVMQQKDICNAAKKKVFVMQER